MQRRDLIIIGGGVGGLVTASVAGQLGLEVTLIERSERLGGDCLHYGCVPSKTLIHSARVAALMRQAARFGLPAFDPPVDLARVNERISAVIAQIQAHDDPARFRGYGVEVRLGQDARFVGPTQIEAGGATIEGKRLVIATGSRPAVPDIPGLQRTGFVTNETIFSLEQLPAQLVVLGAGAVGLELAQAFRRLGSEVTLIEALPKILPREDPDVLEAMTDVLKGDGIALHAGTQAQRVDVDRGRKIAHCNGGLKVEFDTLLVAVGRQPNIEGLELERAGIHYTARGIDVDARMRTSNQRVFACGDVTGLLPFTHVAEYQAGIVIGNALFRFPRKADYQAVPWVIFTDPELARVGRNESQARAEGLQVDTAAYEFEDIDRARTEGVARGFAKLTIHKGRVIGASILGPHAGELIHELAVAVTKRFKPSDVSGLVHAYPTLAEINRRAANAYLSPKLFSKTSKRLVGWINRWIP